MKRYIKSTHDVITTRFNETDKAFGVEVERDDGIDIHETVYFPKSQVDYAVSPYRLEMRIPDWLYRKKISSGFRIKRG